MSMSEAKQNEQHGLSKTLSHINTLATLSMLTLLPLAAQAQVLADVPDWQEMQQIVRTGKQQLQLNIENDSLLLNRDDRFYTSGIHFQQSFAVADQLRQTEYGWRVGQDLYTASDIKLKPAQIPVPDHPYAGWLYGGFFKTSAYATGRSISYGLDIGCLGPCAGGKWTQEQLHHVIKQPQPQGWSTQLKNEFGLMFHAAYAPGRMLPWSGMDLTPTVKGRFGNIMTDVSAQLEWRIGQLNLLPAQDASYGFARVEPKYTAYNATVQGGYFARQANALHAKRWGGELELGYRWQKNGSGVLVSLVRRANEIEEISNAYGAQNFVKLQFNYALK